VTVAELVQDLNRTTYLITVYRVTYHERGHHTLDQAKVGRSIAAMQLWENQVRAVITDDLDRGASCIAHSLRTFYSNTPEIHGELSFTISYSEFKNGRGWFHGYATRGNYTVSSGRRDRW
jgi:hypothetical protein